MIVAGIFRRLKEARLLGQRHGEQEQERAMDQGEYEYEKQNYALSEKERNTFTCVYPSSLCRTVVSILTIIMHSLCLHTYTHIRTGTTYRPNTLRQTQVIVIPANKALSESFDEFNQLIETVNAARRHGRDYVTGSHLERMDGDDIDDGTEIPWSVSVNCAHLHPNFGEKTPEQELEEMKAEEEAGEVDLNYKEYQKQKQAARRSPYPTIVVEVRAHPPPNFGASPSPMRQAQANKPTGGGEEESSSSTVTAEDIQKLEALFGQSAHMNHPTKHLTAKDEEEDFYARIGNSIEELSSVTPMQLAQDFIAMNDPHVPPDSSFTTSDAQEVDEAYEFVFTNFAMMAEQGYRNPRYYVVLPHFCAASATSLEKFTDQLLRLCMASSELRGRLDIDTYHPEHLSPTRRAPVPVLSLQWKNPNQPKPFNEES
jgi:hypothetical protein